MQKKKKPSINELKGSVSVAIINQNMEAIKGGFQKAEQCHLYVSGDGKTLMDECTGKPMNPDTWNP